MANNAAWHGLITTKTVPVNDGATVLVGIFVIALTLIFVVSLPLE